MEKYLKVVHPVFVLAVICIKIVPFLKMRLQCFDFYDVVEYQISVALLATRLGGTDRLPAHQHDLIF